MSSSDRIDVGQLTFEGYGRHGELVWLDGPQAIVRLTVRGWPLAINRFVVDHARMIVTPEDDSLEYVQAWRPFDDVPLGHTTERYDYDEPTTPCLDFSRIIPLPETFYPIFDSQGVLRATLRGEPPVTLQRNILMRTGVDIGDPALSWQQRYEACAFTWPAWRRGLADTLRVLDNQALFGHDTIESWALKNWGGSSDLGLIEAARIGNSPVSHRVVHARESCEITFVFLIFNETDDDVPCPEPLFEALVERHPTLAWTLDCRAFDPLHAERAVFRAVGAQGQVVWDKLKRWGPWGPDGEEMANDAVETNEDDEDE